MPADLDGVTPPPPTRLIFPSPHSNSMWFYRMKVDFATPANTVRTLRGPPLRPGPGPTFAAARHLRAAAGDDAPARPLGDRLMFRAAYRNFVDHESVVVSHSVDPSSPPGVRRALVRLARPGAPTPPAPTSLHSGRSPTRQRPQPLDAVDRDGRR
jgi:hypothetical protein